MSMTRPICDFFIDYGGVEYICEVYCAYDGYIDDIGLFPLKEDGSKGEPIDAETFPIWEQAQQKYEAWYMEEPDPS